MLLRIQSLFAAFAQAQRHRTISYQIQIPEGDKYGYFVPELLSSKCKHDGYDGRDLTREWQQDIQSIRSVYPNGMKIAVQERGTLENFIEKLKERECTAAQYEIWKDTDDALTEYMEALDRTKHPAADELRPYTKTMRCGFPGFYLLRTLAAIRLKIESYNTEFLCYFHLFPDLISTCFCDTMY